MPLILSGRRKSKSPLPPFSKGGKGKGAAGCNGGRLLLFFPLWKRGIQGDLLFTFDSKVNSESPLPPFFKGGKGRSATGCNGGRHWLFSPFGKGGLRGICF